MSNKKNKKFHKFIYMFLICGILGIVSTLAFNSIVLQNALKGYINLAWTNNLFKLRQQYNPAKNMVSNDIVVILFDNDTNARMKTFWPYDRKYVASVLNFLSLAEAKAVVFDIVFPVPLPDKAESDKTLIEAVKNAGNVYLGSRFIYSKSTKLELSNKIKELAIDFKIENKSLDKSLFQFSKKHQLFETSFKELVDVAKGIGFFNAAKKEDITRKSLLILCNGEYCYPNLPMSFFLDEVGTKEVICKPGHHMQIGTIKIPIDANNYFDINWFGAKDAQKESDKKFFYNYKPAWMLIKSYNDILTMSNKLKLSPKEVFKHWENETNQFIVDNLTLTIDPSIFKDKIVFVGVSSSGAHDYINTPFGSMPGVFKHSFVLDNLLTNRFLYTLNDNCILLLVIVLCFLTSLTVIYASSKDFTVLLFLPFIYVLAFSTICIIAFTYYNLNINWIMPSSSIIITFFLGIIYYFFAEGKEKKKVKRAMSNYLSPQIMKIIVENPELVSRSSIQRKTVTIFFFDIRSFTTICENNPPELIAKLLNEYHTAVINAIFKNGGTLDKIIGDAVLAFWNAPVDIDDHPMLAIKSAIEVRKNLKELNLTWEKILKHSVGYGIGINTQEVVVGNIGSDSFMDYTVVGDGVNLAARLEGLNRKYDTNIIISEYTYKLTCDKIYTRYLDITKVKGKAIETKIYEVLRIRD